MGKKRGYLKRGIDEQRDKSPKMCEDCGVIPLEIVRFRNKFWLCPECRNARCGLEKKNLTAKNI